MMSRRAIFLILGLLVILIIIAVVFFTGSGKQGIIPVPIFNPSPTPTTTLGPTDFVFLKATPPSDASGKSQFSPISKITFTFSKGVDPASLKINTNPIIELTTTFSDDSKEITIQPKGLAFWKPYTVYTVSIPAGLKASDGSVLKYDIVYQLQAVTLGGE